MNEQGSADERRLAIVKYTMDAKGRVPTAWNGLKSNIHAKLMVSPVEASI